MNAFLVGLQFLTRIRLVRQTVWTEEDFGRSVRYFPLVGLVLGIVYAVFVVLTVNVPDYIGLEVPVHVRSVCLAVLPFLMTGGLHCDGLMDTVDGIFSGRKREKMLEIMKDSRCGSFGAAAFGVLLLAQYAAILDMPSGLLLYAMLTMPIIGRLMMVVAVSCFPYAREEGMGKAFSSYAGKKTCLLVSLCTAAFLAAAGWQALAAMAAALVFTCLLGRYVTRLLGGLTGDVYGAICILSELLVLLVYLFTYSA